MTIAGLQGFVTVDRINAIRGAAIGGSNSGSAGDINSGSGFVTDSDGVEAGGARSSQSDSCGSRCGAVNADNELNGQGGVGGDDGFVRGDGDHIGNIGDYY